MFVPDSLAACVGARINMCGHRTLHTTLKPHTHYRPMVAPIYVKHVHSSVSDQRAIYKNTMGVVVNHPVGMVLETSLMGVLMERNEIYVKC